MTKAIPNCVIRLNLCASMDENQPKDFKFFLSVLSASANNSSWVSRRTCQKETH